MRLASTTEHHHRAGSRAKISPNLWIDDQAEEAAKFYTAVFKNSKINTIAHYGSAGPLPAGTVTMVDFELL